MPATRSRSWLTASSSPTTCTPARFADQMGDKLIVMVAVADEATREKFSSIDKNRELMNKFDMTMMSRMIELADFDAVESKGLDLDNMIQNFLRNHVVRRGNRNIVTRRD